MNKTSSYEFTVIVPVFNEEDNMQRLEKELSEFALQSPLRTCVLFVNDGSRTTSTTSSKREQGLNQDSEGDTSES